MSLGDLSPDSLREFINMACGPMLGQGMSRTTYRHAFDPTKVIKVENSVAHFQNVREWEIWKDSKYCDKISNFLSPCHFISHSGTFLIMDYARDITIEDVPEKMPQFCCDLKLANLGMLANGNIVLRDYGTTSFNLSTRMVNGRSRVSWRENKQGSF